MKTLHDRDYSDELKREATLWFYHYAGKGRITNDEAARFVQNIILDFLNTPKLYKKFKMDRRIPTKSVIIKWSKSKI